MEEQSTIKHYQSDSPLTTSVVVLKQTTSLPPSTELVPWKALLIQDLSLLRFTNLVHPFWLKQPPSYSQNHCPDR